jgi:4-amino-4-deoxy-L-arabinose transferase-like glycosyltransferase
MLFGTKTVNENHLPLQTSPYRHVDSLHFQSHPHNFSQTMPRSGKFWIILSLILAGSAVVYFTGAQRVPLWDRDEPWYAECSREMLQSGDWVVPTFRPQTAGLPEPSKEARPAEWRLEKPPVVYWCQLAAMAVAGDTAEAARFPSSVAVLLTALLIAVVVRRYTGDRRALWTVFIFCTSGVAIASAKFCITDGVLLLFVMIGQASLAMIYWAARRGKSPPWWTVPAFWISLGLAGITKGPQPLGEHAFTLFILLMLDVVNEGKGLRNRAAWKKNIRWWRNLQPLIGVPILTIVVAPWLILIQQRAPGYYDANHQYHAGFIVALILKARMHLEQSMEGHGKPPGYHALLIFGTFFPWSLLLPTTIVVAWRNRRSAVIRFAIAAMAGPWLMMELVYTKLPFYVLPAFPGLAFLTADTLVRCIRGQYQELRRPSFYATVIVWIIAALGLGAGPWFSLLVAKRDALPINGFIAFSAAAAIYAVLVGWRFFRHQIARAAIVMGVGMAVMLLILYTAILPNMTFLHLPERLAADLTRLGAYGSNVHVLMIGYDEPSLAFYQGGGARRPPAQEAYLEMTPPDQWPKWFVVADDADNWQKVPAEIQRKLTLRAEESGLNYSHEGKIQKVLILENVAARS